MEPQDNDFWNAPAVPFKPTCKRMGVSEPTVYGLIADGEIKSFKVGSRRYILTKSLIEYFERQSKSAQPREPGVEAMLAARAAKRAVRTDRPKLRRRS